MSGERLITQPRQVSALNFKDLQIVDIGCSDAATAVYTQKGDVYLLYDYQCRKIISRFVTVVVIPVTMKNMVSLS